MSIASLKATGDAYGARSVLHQANQHQKQAAQEIAASHARSKATVEETLRRQVHAGTGGL